MVNGAGRLLAADLRRVTHHPRTCGGMVGYAVQVGCGRLVRLTHPTDQRERGRWQFRDGSCDGCAGRLSSSKIFARIVDFPTDGPLIGEANNGSNNAARAADRCPGCVLPLDIKPSTQGRRPRMRAWICPRASPLIRRRLSLSLWR